MFNTKQLFLDYALEVFCNRGRASIHQVIELGELSRDEQRSIVQRKEKFVPRRVWLCKAGVELTKLSVDERIRVVPRKGKFRV